MHKFTDQHQYPFSSQEVLAKLTDPGFLQLKYAALGRRNVELLDHKSHGDQRELKLRYLEPMDHSRLPDIARKFMREETVVEQTTSWDLHARTGTIALRPNGPASMNCRMHIGDSDDGCQLQLNWEISVSIPMMGGRLEKAMAEGMLHKSRRDEEITVHIMRGGE